MAGSIIKSQFEPAKGLTNRHAQTMYQPLRRKIPVLSPRRERLELPNEDFVDLDWLGGETGPIVILLHGMAGSLNSPYAAGMMQYIVRQGWRGVIMYYRGTSGGPNRLLTHTHLGETETVNFLIRTLSQREPDTLLAAVGYSMGANILLKWEGEAAENNPLQAAAAVSPPFDLRRASNYMRSGTSSFYQWLLLRDLRNYFIEKYSYRNVPDILGCTLEDIKNIRSFWEFDDKITAPLHGYLDAADYYGNSSSINYLHAITKPTLIIHAKDDPFIPEACIPDAYQLSNTTVMELSDQGGHVGFVAGTIRKPLYWSEQRIIEFLQPYLG